MALDNRSRDVIEWELQSDKAVEGDVFGFVNHAWRRPQLFNDAIARDGLTDHEGKSYCGRNREVNESS